MSDEPPRRSDPHPSPAAADPSFDGLPYAVLRRYVAGTCDMEERQRVAAWAAAAPARRSYLEALGRTWTRSHDAASDADRAAADAAWTALYARLDVPPESVLPFVAEWEQPPVEIDARRRRPARLLTNAFESRRRLPLVRAAAAVLLVAGGAWAATTAVRERPWSGPGLPMPEREVATGPGQRAQIKLGDGSVVTLASKSRLRFPADFGIRARELRLEGKAYFSVIHDSSRPFVVNAGGSRTTDVGTAFVVRAYPEDRVAEVVVEEGSVLFEARPGRGSARRGAPGRVMLTGGWSGRLARDGGAPVVRKVDPGVFTGWLTGRLIFDDTPLAEVAAELKRWHDVEVRFADPSLARETFTASFTTESAPEILRTLTTVLHLRMERAGKTVVLSRRAH